MIDKLLQAFDAWWRQSFEGWLDFVTEAAQENDPEQIRDAVKNGPCGCREFVRALGEAISLPPEQREDYVRALYHLNRRWTCRVQSASEVYLGALIAFEQAKGRRAAPAVPVGMKN